MTVAAVVAAAGRGNRLGAAVPKALVAVAGVPLVVHAVRTMHAAGADVVPTTLERFNERFPAARTYASAEALCRDPGVDAVWVSSPNRFHAEHTILAAQHGKHVVVEKPMAVTLADAGRMVEAADRYGVKLLAGQMSVDDVLKQSAAAIQKNLIDAQ